MRPSNVDRAWKPCIKALSWLRDMYAYDPYDGSIRSRRSGEYVGSQDEDYRYMTINNVKLGIKRNLLMHRLAWFLETSEWPSIDIDHVNGRKYDNRFDNIRLATGTQNNCNIGKLRTYAGKPTKSTHKGITFNPQNNRWIAQIAFKGKRRHVGCYKTELEAAMAYQEAQLALHGEFARSS